MPHFVNIILIFIYGFVGTVAIRKLVFYPITYWIIEKGNYAEISFDKFVSFYKSAPSKWGLYEYGVRYFPCNEEFGCPFFVYFQSYPDYRRYRKWLRKKLKDRKKETKNKRLLELTKYWSQDVNQHYQSSMDEVFAMYKDNLELSKKYEEEMKRVSQKYKSNGEDIVSYTIEPIERGFL